MRNFVNRGWVWSTWQRVNFRRAHSYYLFLLYCSGTQHVLSYPWLGPGHITVMMSISRFGYFKQFQIEEPKTSFKTGQYCLES